MSDVIIHVEGLGKQFRIGKRQARYQTLRDSLTHAVTSLFHRAAAVLRDMRARTEPIRSHTL